jgi:hypothetical protein
MGQRIDLTTQVQNILPETNGGAGPNIGLRFANSETPSGTMNSSNVTFILARAPNPALSLLLFLAKTLQIQGTDYTLSGATITMTVAPANSSFLAWYRYLTFNMALTFSDGLKMSDAILVDLPVAQIPLNAQDQMILLDFEQKNLTPVLFEETLQQQDGFAKILA